jgi:UMP-CMP kinase
MDGHLEQALERLRAELENRQTASLKGQCRVIFVVGGPGAGKGTQCQRLEQEYPGAVCHVSAGDLLRQEQQDPDSPLGRLILQCLNAGAIVPLQVTISLLERVMQRQLSNCRDASVTFLIDGFPRAIDQGEAFEQAVCPGDAIVYMHCPEAVMRERLLRRAETSGRSDDNPATIQRRFQTFVTTTLPVVDHFRSKVHTVDCDGDMDDVYERFRRVISDIVPLSDS